MNFFFADDRERHICEIQVMHTHLLSVREDMGAHHEYNTFRSALDVIHWYQATGAAENELKSIEAFCPMGHRLLPSKVDSGLCAGCARRPSSGWLLLACASCDWWTCKECAPACRNWNDVGLVCKQGH